MDSIKVADFSNTITNFIQDYDLPYEAKRLALKEVYEDVQKRAQAEILEQARQREAEGNE